MEEFLKMDVFFVVATAVTLLLGVMSSVALYYIIRILRSVDHVSQNISDESDHIKIDLGILRAKVREEGMRLEHFLDLFGGFRSRHHSKKASNKHNK